MDCIICGRTFKYDNVKSCPFCNSLQDMENSKAWYKSKTVWLAVAQFLVGGLMAVATSHPSLGWAVMLKSVLDILLRFVTEQPII